MNNICRIHPSFAVVGLAKLFQEVKDCVGCVEHLRSCAPTALLKHVGVPSPGHVVFSGVSDLPDISHFRQSFTESIMSEGTASGSSNSPQYSQVQVTSEYLRNGFVARARSVCDCVCWSRKCDPFGNTNSV